jgi:hypothetical protein
LNEVWDVSLIEKCNIGGDLAMTLYGALALACLRNHGQGAVADVHFRLGRAHQQTHFLDGIAKLGLSSEDTDAKKSAKYHYLSNCLAGLDMEYVEESPTKVWIRYRAPYYTFDSQLAPSTALAVVQSEVGAAVFKAWHGNNWSFLENPRLAFVQTQLAADADPWDGGYFIEYEHDVDPENHYQRRPGEWGPSFDPRTAPELPADWSNPERRAKSRRGFAIGWLASQIGALVEVLGPDDASAVVLHAYAVTFLQKHRSLMSSLSMSEVTSHAQAATFFSRMLESLGEDVVVETDGQCTTLRQSTSRLTRAVAPFPEQVNEAISSAWQPLLKIWNTSLEVEQTRTMESGDSWGEWQFRVLG